MLNDSFNTQKERTDMKKIFLTIILLAVFVVSFNSCKKSELERIYPDPSKTSTATIENFMTGVFQSANDYTMPWYWKLFVVENSTMGHYTQVYGWLNANDQYLPSSAAQEDRWKAYYTGVMWQYREMQRLYNLATPQEQSEKRIFMIAATIFFYDQSEQIVDTWGDIPWSKAGMLKTNNGDLTASLASYDKAEDIYTSMLDDLKKIATELNSIQVSSVYQGVFANKDYINDGDITAWKKYCNSLRLRMLTRVSGASAFSARAASEISEILGNSSTYPIVENNDENIDLDCKAPDLTSNKDQNIQNGLETWGTQNYAPKAMCDFMNANSDPRTVVFFDPNKNGDYLGIDPMANSATQEDFVNDALVARWDSATFSRNDNVPGLLITAAEVSLIKAEAFSKGWASGDAKAAYEAGVTQSIELFYYINSMGGFRDPLTAPTASEIDAYLAKPGVSWSDNTDKMNLIGTQKWINFNILQMPQGWAEVRRIKKPVLNFLPDNSSPLTLPPTRFTYVSGEKTLNSANYAAVEGEDTYTTKLFWDVN